MNSDVLPKLLDPEVELDPYAFYRDLRARSPVHFDESVGAYLITRHSDVSACYRNPAFSTQNYAWQLEPIMGRTMLQLDGREHARVRGLLTPAFRGHGLSNWLGVVESNVTAILDGTVQRTLDFLLARFRPGDEVDIVSAFGRYYPVFVIADMLALPKEDHGRFYGWYCAQTAFVSNLARDPIIDAEGVAATRDLAEYLAPFVRYRRESPGADLISLLATSKIDGRFLEDTEVITHATHLLNAGSETTDRTLANLLTHLLSDRARFEEVREDRTLIAAAISETLRFTPPSQMNGRLTTDALSVAGIDIPPESLVMLVMASANRDERRFIDPETFNMHRTDLDHESAFTGTGEHFAFGYGRHFCLGAQVAQLEIRASLTAFLDRFPEMHLADGYVPRSRGIKMRSPVEVRVVL
ncbi:unannotated protein [freshwater metagenome]|uniref:Unannotated protein n=1 Tax=freshwater metagenome TaxID=449393 RepID=A0A6J7LH99_9ZZZZ